jgi:two-component system chemotaxis response regulator CheB
MASAQEGAVDEALRVALRVIDERAELVARMSRDAD